jgi:hypothetical protein
MLRVARGMLRVARGMLGVPSKKLDRMVEGALH